MTHLASIAAIIVTMTALAYISSTDAKRRRVSRLPPFKGKRRTLTALCAAFVPGLVLIFIGDGAGFVIWLGTTTIAGWGIATIPPRKSMQAQHRVSRFVANIPVLLSSSAKVANDCFQSFAELRSSSQRIAALQQRVEALEEIVASYGTEEGERRPKQGEKQANTNEDANVENLDLPKRQAALSR